MTIALTQLESVSNVVAGQIATLKIPRGQLLKGVLMRYRVGAADGDLDNLESIAVKLGNDTFTNISGKGLKVWNKIFNVPYGDGYFVIPFTDPNLVDPASTQGLSLVTKGATNVEIKIKVKAGQANPSLVGYGIPYGAGEQGSNAFSLCFAEATHTISGAQKAPIDDLAVMGDGYSVHSIIFDNAASIDNVAVDMIADGTIGVRNEADAAAIKAFNKFNRRLDLTDDDDHLVLDFTGGELVEALVTDRTVYNNLRLTLDTNAAIQPVNIIICYMRPVGKVAQQGISG